MYQTIHGTAGILIGSQTGNAWLAFILGFISHFILDAIPHDSIEIRRWQDKGNFVKKVALEASLDLWLFIILILALQNNNLLTFNWPIVAGIIGALLPDYIWGLAELFKIHNGLMEKYKDFHEWVHRVIYKQIYLPLKYVILIQLMSLIILLGVYIFYK